MNKVSKPVAVPMSTVERVVRRENKSVGIANLLAGIGCYFAGGLSNGVSLEALPFLVCIASGQYETYRYFRWEKNAVVNYRYPQMILLSSAKLSNSLTHVAGFAIPATYALRLVTKKESEPPLTASPFFGFTVMIGLACVTIAGFAQARRPFLKKLIDRQKKFEAA